MMSATAFYLRFVHGWDPLSALLGASPGSMAQVMALSAEFKADLRGIAIVHVMRVLLIVLGLPAGLALFGSAVAPVVSTRGVSETSLGRACDARDAIDRLRRSPCCASDFPAACCSAPWPVRRLLHGTGLVHASLPWWAGSAAVLTLGAVAGARFANTSPRMLLGYLGAAFGSFAVAVAVAASFALIVVALLPFRIADVVIAFAPGAQDTMMVLALALHLDPVYVGRASSGALPGGELLGRRRRAPPRAQRHRRRRRAGNGRGRAHSTIEGCLMSWLDPARAEPPAQQISWLTLQCRSGITPRPGRGPCSGNSSRSQTSTSASASASISASS